MRYDTTGCTSCGAMIRFLPTPDGQLMPVDVDRDPDGVLEAVRIPGRGWGVRVLTAPERALTATLPRYRPHWASCPGAAAHRGSPAATTPAQAPATWHLLGDVRTGPCARCRKPNPRLYGPGPANPFCERCDTETDTHKVC